MWLCYKYMMLRYISSSLLIVIGFFNNPMWLEVQPRGIAQIICSHSSWHFHAHCRLPVHLSLRIYWLQFNARQWNSINGSTEYHVISNCGKSIKSSKIFSYQCATAGKTSGITTTGTLNYFLCDLGLNGTTTVTSSTTGLVNVYYSSLINASNMQVDQVSSKNMVLINNTLYVVIYQTEI